MNGITVPIKNPAIFAGSFCGVVMRRCLGRVGLTGAGVGRIGFGADQVRVVCKYAMTER